MNKPNLECFFRELLYSQAVTNLVVERTKSTPEETCIWLDEWSAIQDPGKKQQAWEAKIGPREELDRLQGEVDRVSNILAGNLHPILARGLEPFLAGEIPTPRPPVQPGKSKVSQSYLNLIFATDQTVKKLLDASRKSNDLVRVDKLQSVLSGGFTGVKLTVPEFRVIHGLFNLLDGGAKVLPDGTIEINGYSELYEAVGMVRKESKRGKREFDGWERTQVNKALWDLAGEPRKIVVKKSGKGAGNKKSSFDVLVTRDSLIKVAYEYRDLAADGKTYVSVTKTSGRPGDSVNPDRILIKPHPCLVLDYERHFRLLPRDPYHEIRSVLPPRKQVKPYQLYFLSWLHRHRLGNKVIQINKESLAQQIGLDYVLRSRRWERLSRTVSSLYRMGKRMGYLADVQEDVPTQKGGIKDVLTLNPEMVLSSKDRDRSGVGRQQSRTKSTAIAHEVDSNRAEVVL